ncbi:MAG: hypothetical protein Q8Q90_01925 [bacterium]|nr:hypothetical protein [bacterium]
MVKRKKINRKNIVSKNKKRKLKVVKRKIVVHEKYYQLNSNWEYLEELKNLVLKISPPSFPKIERGLTKIGKIKLGIITGVFLNMPNTRADIMVVGDDIDFKKFISFIKTLEEEIGTELRYVILGTDEFKYRYGMFDRFVHDILEYPHRKVIDKMGKLVAKI